jgi:hypothetical protein
MVLRRVGVGSAAKVSGALYAALGLVAALIFAAISIVGAGFAAATQADGGPAWLGALFGVGAIVFFPIIYGVMGIVFGALTALLYNVVSGLVGGLEIDLETAPAPSAR